LVAPDLGRPRPHHPSTHTRVSPPHLRSEEPLLEESAALLESGPDRWGRAHVLNLRGYEALNNLDLGRAEDLFAASHELAVELADRAGQAENLLALGHFHLLRGENEEAARALQENRSLLE
jgi:hypothetical protein